MKQTEDNQTCELIGLPSMPVAKRGRGRPVTNPLSVKDQAAERQKARRKRLKASGSEVLTIVVTAEVAAALRKFVEFKDMSQGDALTKILTDRLLRKR